MAFFDKVTDKARELADSAKANVKIAEEKRRIAEFQELVANLVWKEYTEGATFSENITGVCKKIKESYDNIDAINAEIANSRQKNNESKAAANAAVKCASCGAELTADQKFCPKCGAKAPEQPPKAEPEQPSAKHVCAACGVELSAEAAFCPNCGAKVNVQPFETSDVKPEPAPEQPVLKRVCASCGAELSDGSAFCSVCGAKC